MKISDFSNKKVLVMGLGIHGGGLGVANFFLRTGAKVTVTDLKNESQLSSALKKLVGKPELILGQHRKEDFQSADLVVRNPAVPAKSEFLKIARKAEVPVEMESSLFFLLSQTKNIVGVTGTKGKTTTTLLISHLLKKAKFDVVFGGNLRLSMLELLPKIKRNSWVVLELSSWQLEGLTPHHLSPHIAVLTNIYKDHLNRYPAFADYVEAKKLIFEFQGSKDFFITNKNQTLTRKLADQAKSQVKFFSAADLSEEIIRSCRLLGNHNLENVACALTVAGIFGIEKNLLVEGLTSFKPLADRLEDLGQIGGVRFINDTCATAPEAAMAALSTIFAPVILICGGTDKSLDYTQMVRVINKKAKGVVLLEGSATDKIAKNLQKTKVLGRFDNFQTAILAAKNTAKAGDVVLLSPGCASFGMFENEFDRGEKFKRIVKSLKLKN